MPKIKTTTALPIDKIKGVKSLIVTQNQGHWQMPSGVQAIATLACTNTESHAAKLQILIYDKYRVVHHDICFEWRTEISNSPASMQWNYGDMGAVVTEPNQAEDMLALINWTMTLKTASMLEMLNRIPLRWLFCVAIAEQGQETPFYHPCG